MVERIGDRDQNSKGLAIGALHAQGVLLVETEAAECATVQIGGNGEVSLHVTGKAVLSNQDHLIGEVGIGCCNVLTVDVHRCSQGGHNTVCIAELVVRAAGQGRGHGVGTVCGLRIVCVLDQCADVCRQIALNSQAEGGRRILIISVANKGSAAHRNLEHLLVHGHGLLGGHVGLQGHTGNGNSGHLVRTNLAEVCGEGHVHCIEVIVGSIGLDLCICLDVCKSGIAPGKYVLGISVALPNDLVDHDRVHGNGNVEGSRHVVGAVQRYANRGVVDGCLGGSGNTVDRCVDVTCHDRNAGGVEGGQRLKLHAVVGLSGNVCKVDCHLAGGTVVPLYLGRHDLCGNGEAVRHHCLIFCNCGCSLGGIRLCGDDERNENVLCAVNVRAVKLCLYRSRHKRLVCGLDDRIQFCLCGRAKPDACGFVTVVYLVGDTVGVLETGQVTGTDHHGILGRGKNGKTAEHRRDHQKNDRKLRKTEVSCYCFLALIFHCVSTLPF